MTRANPKTTTEPAPSGFDNLAAAISPKWQEAVLNLAKRADLVVAMMPAAYALPNATPAHVQEVRDLIDRLIDYIDGMDPDPDLEPTFGYLPEAGSDECEVPEDDEPSLGSFDRMTDQGKAWLTVQGEFIAGPDAEVDDCDREDDDPDEAKQQPLEMG